MRMKTWGQGRPCADWRCANRRRAPGVLSRGRHGVGARRRTCRTCASGLRSCRCDRHPQPTLLHPACHRPPTGASASTDASGDGPGPGDARRWFLTDASADASTDASADASTDARTRSCPGARPVAGLDMAARTARFAWRSKSHRPRAIRPLGRYGGARAIRDSPSGVGACHRAVRRCEAGARTGGRKLEGSKRETDRNGSAYPALLVEYDDVLVFLPRVCCVF